MENSFVEIINDSDKEQWINALPNYQSKIIHSLIKEEGSAEGAVIEYFNVSFPNTAPFSAGKTDKVFYKKVKEEVKEFLCGSPKYENDRQKIKFEGKNIHTFVISCIAVSISPYVGTAAPFLAPAIALILSTISKVTLSAWCQLEIE